MSALDVVIAPKMVPFALQRRRHKIARGGRGSGKSWSVARILAARGVARPTRWLCCRETQRSIKESSLQLLADQIEDLRLTRLYDIQRDQIIGPRGTRFVFTGLREHTSDSIKSYEGFDGAWVEEAQRVSHRSAQTLVPTIRNDDSELWWTYNPDQDDDYVHTLANSGRSDVLVVDINWQDNPFFPYVLDSERLALKALNDDLYRHVWEGECRSVSGILFKRPWFKFYDRLPANLNLYMASDYAVTEDGGDWTEHGVIGLDDSGNMYAVDWWSGQTEPDVWIEAALTLVRKHRPLMWFEEKGVILRALGPTLTKAMQQARTYTMRTPIASASQKAERALGFAARCSMGTFYLPRTEWAERLVNQACAFTGDEGRVDDMVDTCSLMTRGLDHMWNAKAETATEEVPRIKPFTREHFEYAEREEARERAAIDRYYR